MNRRERRTRGLWLIKRLYRLKNSPLLQEADLKDVPKDVLKTLIAGTCENKDMQRKYRSLNSILGEILELEKELLDMKLDLEAKRPKGIFH